MNDMSFACESLRARPVPARVPLDPQHRLLFRCSLGSAATRFRCWFAKHGLALLLVLAGGGSLRRPAARLDRYF